jgi:hypothetical protein
MPPFLPHPPIDALGPTGPRWLEVALTIVAVACEPWVLALIALALYSWLEREVAAVLEVFAPLAVALTVGGVVAIAARAAWAAPHLAGAGGDGLAAFLHAALPGARVVALGVVVAYSLLAYGRRALPLLVLAGMGIGARIHAGAQWPAELLVGGLSGALLGLTAFLVAVRVVPGGHLARARMGRRGGRERAPDPPAPPSQP